jgi:hypothetical protein
MPFPIRPMKRLPNRTERRSKMTKYRSDMPNAVRRRVRSDGVIEEWSAAMGWVSTIPADPRPRKLGVSADAANWERLQTFL